MISRLALSAAALAVSAGVASAGLIWETEPNDSPSTADNIGTYSSPGGSLTVDGFITPGVPNDEPDDAIPGDVDWFSFTVTDFAFVGVTVFAFDLGGQPFGGPVEADAALLLLDSEGGIIAFSDDDGPGLNPSFGAFLLPGTYTIGVAPYEDINYGDDSRGDSGEFPVEIFDGFDEYDGNRPTTENFAYKLIFGANVAPAPGAATMLGMTGLIALRRRR